MTDLVKQFGASCQWTNWRYETVNGKITKVPYFSKTKKAASNDPSTWKTYADAEEALNNGSNRFDGVGIFFKEDRMLMGIDIDHCLDDGEIVHEQKDTILGLITAAHTFSEVSPSGAGIHLFFSLTEPYALKANKKAPFEFYNRVRFLTVTNNPYEDKPVRKVSPQELDAILSVTGYPWTKKEVSHSSSGKTALTDEQVLAKMFSSKIGAKHKALYNGDLSEYKDDKSSADYALCSSFAFWSRRDASQIERLWLASPLGQREKTQERKDYRERTIKKAIENCAHVYETTAMKVEKENPAIEFLMSYNAKGEAVVVQNTENICRVLRDHEHFKGRFRFDAFKNVYQLCDTKTNTWRQVEDADAISLQTAISILFPPFCKVGKEMVYDALVKVCRENMIDSAVDYIKSLTWDGKARLDTWLTTVYGATNDVYHQKVGSNWIKGMVKRLVEPGCKFDYVLVLEGKQGVRKSTSLSVLGGDWHVETTMSTDTKDFFMQFAGKSIIEFSEGETLNRTEVKRMKAIITMQYDRLRLPYERATQDFPRRCVFAMTTNQTEYLKDETGNRRWLPVLVKKDYADVEWLAQNRDQLFAEAYHRITQLSETVYEFPEEELRIEQEKRQIIDSREEAVMDWYYNRLGESERLAGITTQQAYVGAILKGMSSNFSGKEISRIDEIMIGSVLINKMKLRRERVMVNNIRVYRYFESEESKAIAPVSPNIISADEVLANW